jgi:D-sedoheptulose 7-phosphate isomerase
MQLILNSLNEATGLLNEFIADEGNIEKIKQAGDIMSVSINSGNTIFSCGNGGSLCDAMHFAEELTGRFRNNRRPLPAISISDPSHITCVGNDYGFDYIFSKYIEANGRKGDVLLAISTSGNSANILEAVRAAKLKGIKVIALTGKEGGVIGPLADVEIRVPWKKYSDRIQEIHIKIIHILIEYIESNL